MSQPPPDNLSANPGQPLLPVGRPDDPQPPPKQSKKNYWIWPLGLGCGLAGLAAAPAIAVFIGVAIQAITDPTVWNQDEAFRKASSTPAARELAQKLVLEPGSLKQERDSRGIFHVTGIILNKSRAPIGYAQIEFDGLNKKGDRVETGKASTIELGGGGSWAFDVNMRNSKVARVSDPKILAVPL